MSDQTLVQDRSDTDQTVETPTVTDTPPAHDEVGTPTTDPKVTLLRTKRAMAAAAAGLVLVGGAGGFAIGHATAGDGSGSTSFGPGGQGGFPGGQTGQGGPNGQTGGQNGFPGTQNGQMGTPPGMQSDGTTQDDSTTDGTSSST